MKCYLSLVCLALGFGSSAFAANAFDAWTGSWSGSCKLSPPYNGTAEFDASLSIGIGAKPDHLQWKLIYEASGNLPRQVRNYEMLEVDFAKGHYVVDEHNGLLLDSFLDGKVLYSPFSINGKLITATYILLSQNEMLIDMPSFDARPIRKTCVTGNSNLCAESFGLRMTQRCMLKRSTPLRRGD